VHEAKGTNGCSQLQELPFVTLAENVYLFSLGVPRKSQAKDKSFDRFFLLLDFFFLISIYVNHCLGTTVEMLGTVI